MIDFSKLQSLTIPEGVVTQITDASGRVLWVLSGGKVVLEVEKITSKTYDGSTAYDDERFILLSVYPRTNSTVSITYGGLTKTITDTSGTERPNAQQVFFGTFNGVSDIVETPASGELTIEGECYAFAFGIFKQDKMLSYNCACITEIKSFGSVNEIPVAAFSLILHVGNGLRKVDLSGIKSIGNSAFLESAIEGDLMIPSSVEYIGDSAFSSVNNLTSVTIGNGVKSIGCSAFVRYASSSSTGLRHVTMLSETPPSMTIFTSEDDSGNSVSYYNSFGRFGDESYALPNKIIVPKGSASTYKSTEGWSDYAGIIVEAS